MTARKVVEKYETTRTRYLDTCSSCGHDYEVCSEERNRDDGGLCDGCHEKRNAEKAKSDHAYLSGAVVVDFVVRGEYRRADVFGVVLRSTDGRTFHVYAKPNYSEGETADLEIEEVK